MKKKILNLINARLRNLKTELKKGYITAKYKMLLDNRINELEFLKSQVSELEENDAK